MRIPLLTVLAALALQPAAKADKFWFESPDRKDRIEGSSPAYIEGVLLREQDEQYVIRVVGGEVTVPKRLVVAIEQDDFSLDALAAAEKDMQDRAAERRAVAQEAAARRSAEAVEAAVRRAEAIEPAPVRIVVEPAPPAPVPTFDPVIGAMVPGGVPAQMLEDRVLLRELALAYELTQDRSYVKMLRVLRRLR